MRTSKFFPVLCAAIACAPLIVARGDDNPAQAAARAALMEKMNDLDAPMQNQTSSPSAGEMQTATNAVEAQPAPIIVTTNGATVEQPAPAMTNSPPIAEPMPETVPAATNAEVTPVTAMTNSMPASEPAPETTPAMTNTTEVPPVPPMTNSEPAVPVPPPVPAMAETNAVEIQPAPTTTNSMAAPEPIPETIPAMTNAVATNNAAATESPSLRIQPDAVSMSQPKEKPVNVKPSEPAKAPSPMQNPAFPPIQAPPLPISTSKEARLQALDAKYKADQVSPEEYFKQREAILAEP